MRFVRLTAIAAGTAVAIVGGVLTSAQMPNNSRPLVDGFTFLFGGVERSIMATAEAVPEPLYTYKPTPDVRSLGAILGHVADANNALCEGAAGQNVDLKDTVEKGVTSKAGLIAALRDSFAKCKAVYDPMTDAAAAKPVPFGKGTAAAATLLSFAVSHANEHYGNLVTYMRLNNIVPPSSRTGDNR